MKESRNNTDMPRCWSPFVDTIQIDKYSREMGCSSHFMFYLDSHKMVLSACFELDPSITKGQLEQVMVVSWLWIYKIIIYLYLTSKAIRMQSIGTHGGFRTNVYTWSTLMYIVMCFIGTRSCMSANKVLETLYIDV